MRAKYRKRIKELEDRVNSLQKDSIPACKVIVSHRNHHVATGQEFSVQEVVKLLLDELGLSIVRTPASIKLEKKPGKCKNPNKVL